MISLSVIRKNDDYFDFLYRAIMSPERSIYPRKCSLAGGNDAAGNVFWLICACCGGNLSLIARMLETVWSSSSGDVSAVLVGALGDDLAFFDQLPQV